MTIISIIPIFTKHIQHNRTNNMTIKKQEILINKNTIKIIKIFKIIPKVFNNKINHPIVIKGDIKTKEIVLKKEVLIMKNMMIWTITEII